ncbi:MAG: T9SS type A sorting domain-containing protein [candidate division Zixibacteria bacterium]|nr:T9SS type A sorting domain-containing protein [candidate division Zixibacteria bacterium]
MEIPITARAEMVFGDQSQIRLNQALLATAEATAVRVENIDGPLPTSFVLHQNYPNPFNPTTTIAFSFGSQGGGGISQRVTLDIFNILGQSVTNILDSYLPPGNHEVSWDGTDRRGRSVASGIYLYRLSVGEESQSKKMLLLK